MGLDTSYAAGATSKIINVRAITISTGLPYTGGAFNTATISATYKRDGAAATTITLVTATAGTYTSSGFVHAGKGVYEIGAPTAALAAGADGVTFQVDGIADVLFSATRVDLTGVDPRSSDPVVANTTQLAGQTVTAAAGVTFPTSVASPTNITAGTVTTATNVTTVNGLAANVITAASIAADAITSAKIATDAIDGDAIKADAATKIGNASVESSITALLTYSRTANDVGTINGPTSGSNALGITTDATYLPLKTL